MAEVQAANTGDAQAPDSSENESAPKRRGAGQRRALFRGLPLRRGLRLPRFRRRIVVAVAAAAMVMLGGALSVTFLTRGSTSGQLVNGNVIEYAAGHRPLAPDLTATALTGSPVKMSSYRGKVLVLNFWSSWCSPCRREAPVLQVAYQQYHAQGVDFLGDDMGDTAANALSFIRTESIGYPSISDPGYAFVQQFSRAAPVNDPPTTAVIDKTGHVVGIVLGPINDGELTALIHKAALMG